MNRMRRCLLAAAAARFAALGATVIDTAPVYADAETVLGSLLEDLRLRPRLLLATKVSTSGRDAGVKQVEKSFKRVRTTHIDLIAVHDLRDTQTHLATLRELKSRARVRYVGITISFDRQYGDFEATMRREAVDFIQVDYALDNRAAGERILPLAADRGMARPEYVEDNLGAARGRLPDAAQRPNGKLH